MTSSKLVPIKVPEYLAQDILAQAKARGISPREFLEVLLDQAHKEPEHSPDQLSLDLPSVGGPDLATSQEAGPGSKTLTFAQFADLAGWSYEDREAILKDMLRRSVSGRVIQGLSQGQSIYQYRFISPFNDHRVPADGIFIYYQRPNGLPAGPLPGLRQAKKPR